MTPVWWWRSGGTLQVERTTRKPFGWSRVVDFNGRNDRFYSPLHPNWWAHAWYAFTGRCYRLLMLSGFYVVDEGCYYASGRFVWPRQPLHMRWRPWKAWHEPFLWLWRGYL